MTTHDEKRARSFKALSALLSYPTEDLKKAADDIADVLRHEGMVRGRNLKALESLIGEIRDRDLYDLQERYTLLFDRSRSLSLHLFEHVHGESRDRGQAMVDLADHYEENGFVVSARELPDYLPLFLEFLSVIPADEAVSLLSDPQAVIAALEQRLRKRKSSYAAVFQALIAMAKGKVDPARLSALTAMPDTDPEDLDAIDADWEETEVLFGPGAADTGCGSDRLQTRLRAAMLDVNQMPPRA